MSEFNDWFCSLPEGRQAVLRDDKWRLADNAFQSGFEQAHAEIERLQAQNAELLAALIEALPYIEATLNNHDAGCQRHPSTEYARQGIESDLDQAKQAIAKAKGGQP